MATTGGEILSAVRKKTILRVFQLTLNFQMERLTEKDKDGENKEHGFSVLLKESKNLNCI